MPPRQAYISFIDSIIKVNEISECIAKLRKTEEIYTSERIKQTSTVMNMDDLIQNAGYSETNQNAWAQFFKTNDVIS